MNIAELDQLRQNASRKIVSAEITDGPGPLPHGVFEQAPRVIATLDDGDRVELFSFYAHERSFSPGEFVGLRIEEARRLKFAADRPPGACSTAPAAMTPSSIDLGGVIRAVQSETA